MNELRLLSVIQSPYITEKSSQSSGNYRLYAFKVALDATKPEIGQAIEHLFKTKVHSVRVCRVKGKQVRFGRVEGRTKAWKKAYVSLAAGQEIDLTKI